MILHIFLKIGPLKQPSIVRENMVSVSIHKRIQPILKCKAFQRGQNINSFQLFHASFRKKMSWILSLWMITEQDFVYFLVIIMCSIRF